LPARCYNAPDDTTTARQFILKGLPRRGGRAGEAGRPLRNHLRICPHQRMTRFYAIKGSVSAADAARRERARP
jgi:hypothetical protein